MQFDKQTLEALNNAYDNGISYNVCAASARAFQAQKKRFFTSQTIPVDEFAVSVNPDIPPLAWICEIKKNRYTFTVGKKVEFGTNFIVEGVWDNVFSNHEFGASDHFYGTGAFLDENGVCVFVPPRLCTDFLFVMYDDNRKTTWVSNSFCYIFNRSGIDLEGNFYKAIKNTINTSSNAESALGADRGSPFIAKCESYSMYRLMYHNFTVDNHGCLNYLMRTPAKLHIDTFVDYKNFLLKTTKAIIANGCASQRKNTFGTITMLSTGYDSTAVSAICAQAGVREAITMDVITTGHDDCGDKIAAALGLDCHIVESPLGKVVPLLKTAFMSESKQYLEFIATAGIGDNIAFYNMADFIKDKIVFSGLYGDGTWSLNGNGGGLAHHLPYMKSRNEFRLRVGYYLVPPPAFGAYFPYALKKVGSEPDMAPYRLGNAYDRPIPRRIAEDAGVPRALFGQRKAANNPDIVNWKELFDDAVKHVMQRYDDGRRSF